MDPCCWLTLISSRNSAVHTLRLFYFIFPTVFQVCVCFPLSPRGPQWYSRAKCVADVRCWWEGGIAFAMRSVCRTTRCNRRSIAVQWAANGCRRNDSCSFICYGNQCLPGDESAANTPLLISQFLPCTPQTGDRERPELLSVKSSTVTTDRPSSPRQRTPSEVGLRDAAVAIMHEVFPVLNITHS